MIAAANPLVQWSWVRQNLGMIGSALAQHAELSALAVVIGLAISLPMALLISRYPRLRVPVLGFTGLLYTIPSIALFALIEPITGFFSTTTGEVALVSYTLLILTRNTVAGLDEVPNEVREAGKALGYTNFSKLWRIELPLALPSILAGLRVATVTVVGLVTVTAFIGLGGLGQLIIQGFGESFNTPIVVALVLSILLAGIGDLLFVLLERLLVPWTRSRKLTS